MSIIRPTDDRLPPRKQIALVPGRSVAEQIREATAKARRWRVTVRKTETLPPEFPDHDSFKIDIIHDWIWRGGSVERQTIVHDGEEISHGLGSIDLETAIRRISSYEKDRVDFEFLRLGWTVKQIVWAFAPVCFHPATVEQWASTIERERLTKLLPREVTDGTLEEAGAGLRMERFGLWLSEDGTSLYAIGSSKAGTLDRLVVARLDPTSVRLVPRSEGPDASHHRPA